MSDYSKAIEHFNTTVDSKANLSFIVRDSDLQCNALDELTALSAEVEVWKKQAISERDEHHANLFLGCECAIEALKAELNMWLELKEGKPDAAWNNLIVAQMATRNAIRAHKGFSHLEVRAVRLVKIERVVFPQQVFFSAGMIVGRQRCSICGGEYGECLHLIGMPYMGEFCRCLLEDVQGDHVAIVKEPANKQCRVVSFNADGGKRNRMTWRVDPTRIHNPNSDEKGLMVDGVLLALRDIGAKRSAQ